MLEYNVICKLELIDMKSIFALMAFCCLAPQVVAQAATSQAKASWQIEKVDYFTEPTSTAGVERKKAAVRFTNRQRIELPLDNTVVIAVLRGSDQSEFLLAPRHKLHGM